MRRRFFWLAALAGIVWLYLRRGARRPEPVQVPPASDPAEELRRKLEQTKESGDAPAAPAASEQVPQPQAEATGPSAPADSEELDAKRREVHERARSASDEMRRSSSD